MRESLERRGQPGEKRGAPDEGEAWKETAARRERSAPGRGSGLARKKALFTAARQGAAAALAPPPDEPAVELEPDEPDDPDDDEEDEDDEAEDDDEDESPAVGVEVSGFFDGDSGALGFSALVSPARESLR